MKNPFLTDTLVKNLAVTIRHQISCNLDEAFACAIADMDKAMAKSFKLTFNVEVAEIEKAAGRYTVQTKCQSCVDMKQKFESDPDDVDGSQTLFDHLEESEN